ncbi:MAG: PHP domain-containing protein [Planctomycetaceae bacterium]
MKRPGPLLLLAALALALLLLPPLEVWSIEVRRIDADGTERACPPEFATLVLPERESPRIDALFVDLCYAADAAGPDGCATLVAALALLALLTGLFGRGVRAGARRLLLVVALSCPAVLALLYASCFQEGRRLELGPAARGFVQANLHAHTDRSTGLLPARDVARWHWSRGIRVLCVTDKNNHQSSLEAIQAAAALQADPPFLVLPGEEYQGDAHVVLVNAKRTFRPDRDSLAATLAEVREGGGATILAHPWYGIRLPPPFERMLEQGIDGMEVVNRVVQAGMQMTSAAVRGKKSLLGALDFKYGPHVTAVTLLTSRDAASAEGVVDALRNARTLALFAVPGGSMASSSFEAQPLWLNGARRGLRSLAETPRPRRLVWLASLAAILALWRLATRRRSPPSRPRAWRALFLLCCGAQFLLLGLVSWQVREALGTLPVRLLLAAGAVAALPLLASLHALSCDER